MSVLMAYIIHHAARIRPKKPSQSECADRCMYASSLIPTRSCIFNVRHLKFANINVRHMKIDPANSADLSAQIASAIRDAIVAGD